jgi:hypothetical protein
MPTIDIRSHIVYAAGTWRDPVLLAEEAPFPFTLADTCSASKLLLRWTGDAVALAGPLRIRVTFQSENVTYRLGAWTPPDQILAGDGGLTLLGDAPSGLPVNRAALVSLIGAGTLQAGTVYSYALDIPAGQVWPFTYGERDTADLGNNLYDRVTIEVAGFEAAPVPVAASCDLPCDFAVQDRPDAGAFFPVACEPCDPAAQVRMPPTAPALSVSAADGGCVRTRFFNGMFITREDLETEQRYVRVKNRLRNRAAGQGVVWGLNVGRSGDHVYVLPGYAVDCCGNDLTVTTAYRVEIAALLRDPAVAALCASASGAPKQVALLLEYVECPTEPRPVHGDPCGPAQQACEPSRIRETVRLRLVPPRPPATSGPMAEFLATAQTLHDKYGERLDAVTDLPPAAQVQLRLRAGDADVTASTDGVAVDTGLAGAVDASVSAEPDGVLLGVFTGGTLEIASADGQVLATTPLALLSSPGAPGLALTLDPAQAYTVTLAGWRVETPLAPAPGWADTGTAVWDLAAAGATWQLTGRETVPRARVVPARTEACAEPCAVPVARVPGIAGATAGVTVTPSAADAAGIRWPWLHSDPLDPARAGDPKALALGLLGAWMQQSTASSAEAGVSEPSSFAVVASTALYRAAWLWFYGVAGGDEQCEVGDALQRLLRGWCAAMLYPGPVCAGEPHGVVIGCTTVSAGTLGDVDPFGGRRYVVQWPLLSHWGGQVGLAPLDLTATRLFSTLCCIAALPCPASAGARPAFVARLGEDEAGGDAVYLAFGAEAALPDLWAREAGTPWDVAATHQVSAGLLLTYAVSALGGSAPPSTLALDPAGIDVVERYTVGGVVELGVASLLVARKVARARRPVA